MKIKKFIKEHWITILIVIYLISPIDFLPEAILGPVGLADDAGALLLEIANLVIKNRKKNNTKSSSNTETNNDFVEGKIVEE